MYFNTLWKDWHKMLNDQRIQDANDEILNDRNIDIGERRKRMHQIYRMMMQAEIADKDGFVNRQCCSYCTDCKLRFGTTNTK